MWVSLERKRWTRNDRQTIVLRMEIFELKYFLAVAREEHIHRASEKLRVSPPALSKAIARLEDELGKKLFAREGRHIRLTDEGRALKARAFEESWSSRRRRGWKSSAAPLRSTPSSRDRRCCFLRWDFRSPTKSARAFPAPLSSYKSATRQRRCGRCRRRGAPRARYGGRCSRA